MRLRDIVLHKKQGKEELDLIDLIKLQNEEFDEYVVKIKNKSNTTISRIDDNTIKVVHNLGMIKL